MTTHSHPTTSLGTPRPPLTRGIAAALLAIACCAAPLATAQAPDRSRPPDPGPPPTFRMPPIEKRTLSNGLAVRVVARHEVPVVQVNLVVTAGAAADPRERFGAASFTSAMLQEGAGGRSATELAEAIEYLGASLGADADMDASAVRLHVPVARLAPALALMADVALRPTFSDADVERVRRRRLTALQQARDDPGTLAAIAFPRVVFGPTHRYGTPDVGTADTLRAMTADDLRAFHGRYYRPSLSQLIVAGDVTAEGVLPLLESAFGGWRAEPVPPPAALATRPVASKREIVVVDRPGASQSTITIGRVGVARSTPDYFPIVAMNTLLGGAFTSRLNQNLRETHGYSYGAFSTFEMHASPGPFLAAASVQADRTSEAVREFFNEFDRLLAPIPAGELSRAVNFVALGFPARFATTAGIAGQLETLFVHGLPDTYYTEYVPNLLAVTSEGVRRVAAQYIQPRTFLVVVAGDRKAIEPGLRALGLGAVRVMTLDDVLGATATGTPETPARRAPRRAVTGWAAPTGRG